MIDRFANNGEENVQDILSRRARMLSLQMDTDESEDESLHLLAFSLGEDRFGIDLKFVREVQPLKRLQWSLIPCTPNFITGVVNIRSNIYSIMHISHFLGITSGKLSEQAHVILVCVNDPTNKRKMELALIADDFPKSEIVKQASIQAPEGNVSEKTQVYASGVTGSLITLLNLEKLLLDPDIIIDDHQN